MNWKYKYFTQEAVFQAEPNIVQAALQDFAEDWLDDWKVSKTWDGLEAKSLPGFRAGTARFRIEQASGGTKVTVEMQVVRTTHLALGQFDIGGLYSRQICEWLQALPWWIQQRQSAAHQSDGQQRKPVPAAPPIPKPVRPADRLTGWVTMLIVLAGSIYALFAIAGLLTGNLYIPGNESGVTIHGRWARILAASILLLFGWIGQRLWKVKKLNRARGGQPRREVV